MTFEEMIEEKGSIVKDLRKEFSDMETEKGRSWVSVPVSCCCITNSSLNSCAFSPSLVLRLTRLSQAVPLDFPHEVAEGWLPCWTLPWKESSPVCLQLF